jgi:serine/threonine protein kinase
MLKIGDFGFSVRKFRPGSLTMMKSKVGTPGYMPPQILNS